MANLFGNLTDVINTINTHNKEMLFLKNSQHTNFPEMFQMHVNAEVLHEYGCWCYRGRADFGRALGRVVDKFDEICRDFQQAYECVYKDGPLNGAADCDPLEQSRLGYSWDVEYEVTNMKVDTILTCTGTPENWCEVTVCEIDMMYTKRYLDLLLDGEEPNYEEYAHDAGGFLANRECPFGTPESSGGSGAVAPPQMPYKKCCGKYPTRKIYRTDKGGPAGGVRSCCDIEGENNAGNTASRTYKTASHVCCGLQGVQQGDTCY